MRALTPTCATKALRLLWLPARTVTLAVAWENAPLLSVTVRITGVTPTGYGPGGVCVTVMVSPGSGSEEPSFTDAFALQAKPEVTVTSLALATGGSLTTQELMQAPATFKVYFVPMAAPG